jgi:cyclopropane-fatty-acyl-phospholipid synthase
MKARRSSLPDTTSIAAAVLQRIFANHDALDFSIRLWDGSTPIQPSDGPPRFTLVINHPGALRRMFLPPSELSLGEAFIFQDFDIEGDIVAAAGLADYFQQDMRMKIPELFWLARNLLRLPHGNPDETLRPGLKSTGRTHTRQRDRETVQYHYDVSNDFYQLWLDDWMNYSCAYFITGEEDIHTAQRQKMEHICRKLRLQPGERLLDIGCGWGGLAIYAARHYDVRVTGVTLSQNQLELARERAEEAGVSDRVEFRLQDYREVLAEPSYDKIVSVGMVEHVGVKNLSRYFAQAWRVLKKGGLFLNHAIGAMSSHLPAQSLGRWLFRANSFMDRYVFPDGELVDIHHMLRDAEAAGFEVRDVEALREHYALTLRHWVRRLEENHNMALRYVDEPTYRVWRIYMAGTSHSFANSRINVYQTLLSKNIGHGQSLQPWTRAHLYTR